MLGEELGTYKYFKNNYIFTCLYKYQLYFIAYNGKC